MLSLDAKDTVTSHEHAHTPPERDIGLAPVDAKSGDDMLKASDVTAKEEVKVKEEEPRRGSSMAFTIDLSDGAEAGASPVVPAAPAQAFTVDFGGVEEDEKRQKRLGMRDSLSQFLPTKVRQSFRSRGSKPKRQNDDPNDEVNFAKTSQLTI